MNYIGWTIGNIIISPNKSFEYQFEFGEDADFNPFELSFRWTSKQDHAGPSFIFGIKYLFWINLRIYDHRHWDYSKNCWELSDGAEENE